MNKRKIIIACILGGAISAAIVGSQILFKPVKEETKVEQLSVPSNEEKREEVKEENEQEPSSKEEASSQEETQETQETVEVKPEASSEPVQATVEVEGNMVHVPPVQEEEVTITDSMDSQEIPTP